MRSRHRITMPVAALAPLAAILAGGLGTAAAQSGGGYDLTWNTIDGGGGRSSGGSYAVTGTIGQHDAGLLTGGTFSLAGGFWLGGAGSDPSGLEETPPPAGPGATVPLAFRLHANAPNPFANSTALAFDLPAPAEVRLAVFEPGGSRVRELIHGALPAGRHVQVWDGTNDRGDRLPSGIYFLRLDAGERRAQRKLWLVR